MRKPIFLLTCALALALAGCGPNRGNQYEYSEADGTFDTVPYTTSLPNVDSGAAPPAADAALDVTATPPVDADTLPDTGPGWGLDPLTVSATLSVSATALAPSPTPAADPATSPLSVWPGQTLTGPEGASLGVVTDYLVNLCSGQLGYAVITPDASLVQPGGDQVWLLPHAALQVEAAGFAAPNLTAASLTASPAMPRQLDLKDPAWGDALANYWGAQGVTPAALGCTPAGAAPEDLTGRTVSTPQLAYLSQLTGGVLQDASGTVLGQVQEVTAAPRSGALGYLIVAPTSGISGAGSLIPLPLRLATLTGLQPNPDPTLPAHAILTLAGGPALLNTAPVITTLPAADSPEWAAILDRWTASLQAQPAATLTPTP